MNYLQEFYSSFSIPFSFENGVVEWFPQADEVAPTESVVTQKLNKYKTNKAWSDLRKQRNYLLAQTDWMALNDVVVSEEWKAYRQALRDLPANSEPQLDETGNLTNVIWPTKPGENT